ncbi:MAG: endolytic transglycosylase MltG, partial [Niameybacter sp.]
VSKGDSVYDIAYKLKEKAIIRSELLFRTYVKVLRMDPALQYGVHKINTNMAYGEIIYELEKHTTSAETVKVTFPEGFTLLKIANRLEANEICSADEFLEAFNTTDFGFDFEGEVSDNKLKYFKKEGFAFPDTYKFEKGENPYNVANKIAKNFESKITPEMYARMNEIGISLEETIIVASIVQSEAGESDEMKKVASVYFNRLKNKDVYPNLQADPTRKYVREIKAVMDIANQEILSAYNTYEGAGLPPGAIANPGIDAIMATLYPDDTPYFYFCTNLDTKRFYYAETLKEHEDNLFRAGLV